MEATFKTEELRNAIKAINMLVTRRGRVTLPILVYATLVVADSKATITTTDLEKAIRITIDAKADSSFEVIIPKGRLERFLTGANGESVIKVNERGGVTITRGELGDLSYSPAKVNEFPPIPAPTPETIWSKVDAKWFCQMLRILVTACNKEDSRPVLTGAGFSDGAVASADGFRLVAVKHPNIKNGLGDKSAIVPAETLALIPRLFNKVESIEIGFDDLTNKSGFGIAPHFQKCYFKAGGILITSQTIQGTFPNYEALIPKKYDNKVSISAPLFMQRLRMMDCKTLNSGIVKLVFHRKDETNEPICLISGGQKDEDFAEYYSMTLPCTIDGETKIAVNYKYLYDAIAPFAICDIELTSPSSPLKITGDVEGLTVVVMPMFVQW